VARGEKGATGVVRGSSKFKVQGSKFKVQSLKWNRGIAASLATFGHLTDGRCKAETDLGCTPTRINIRTAVPLLTRFGEGRVPPVASAAGGGADDEVARAG